MMAGYHYEQEGPQTIEQAFHLLSTRLYNIQNGRIESGSGIMADFGYNEDYNQSIIRPIISSIFSFPALESLDKLNQTIERMQQLQDDKLAVIERIDIKDYVIAPSPDRVNKFKQEATKDIERELNFYAGELKKIKEELSFQVENNKSAILSKSMPTTDLPPNIKFKPIPDGQIAAMDKYQSALLFHFLREKGAIKYLSNSALAQMISLLTGHSEDNIRQQALGKIYDVMTDKVKNKMNISKSHNLTIVADLLDSILSDIRLQINKNKQ